MSDSRIQLDVKLDDNKIPEKITWSASDQEKMKEAKAFLLSIWDEKELNTLRIDLWTKEMKVDEMKMFTFQTLMTLADTFEKATGETQMSMAMRDFSDYFAEKMKLEK